MASRYPVGNSPYGGARGNPLEEDEEDEDDEPTSSDSAPHDGIHRSYLQNQQMNPQAGQNNATRPETIQVQLNEGVFANERRYVHDLLASARSRLAAMQMFNPVKNQSLREQQEQWDEKVSRSAREGHLGEQPLSSIVSKGCFLYSVGRAKCFDSI